MTTRVMREISLLVDADEEKWSRWRSMSDKVNTSPHKSGIYELSVVTGENGRRVIVYVGGAVNLHDRHASYIKDGSHKDENFKRVHERAWTIWVRHITTETVFDAFMLEHQYLMTFDYAWNIKENGKERQLIDAVTNEKERLEKTRKKIPLKEVSARKRTVLQKQYGNHEKKNADLDAERRKRDEILRKKREGTKDEKPGGSK